MEARRGPRRLLPMWLWVVLFLAASLVVWMRTADPFGDRGMSNAWTMVTVLVTAIVLLVGYGISGGGPLGRRLGVVLGVLALVALGLTLFRLEGFSGTMVPEFRWRFAEREAVSFGAPEPGAGDPPVRAVDLVASTPLDFPGFLGPERDATVRGVRLARDWGAQPPELVWRREVGAAWSAFVVVNGVAVTMEERSGETAVAAYDVATGAPLWTYSWSGEYDHFLGGPGPRGTPEIHGGRVYALGPRARLVCLSGADGALLWEHDLLDDYDISPEAEFDAVQYGRSNSPLVLGGRVIVPVGGIAESGRQFGLVAFDAETGEVVWKGPPRQISFSSPRATELAGRAQVLIVNEGTASGHDPESGALLWENPWPGVTSANASVSQAVPVPPNSVLLSKGYGGGATLLELVPREDGTFDTRTVWSDRRVLRTKFTNVVVKGEHVYGLSDGILECVELASGKRVWRAGRYGHGQILLVGELLLVLGEEGELSLVDPRPEEPADELGRIQALEGKTWNNLALYGELLLVRNGAEAAAWRLPLATGSAGAPGGD